MKRQILGGMGIMLFALGLIAARADAYPVTIYIEAEVDSVSDAGNYLEGKISVGDIITGWYIYESTTADSSLADPVQGNYWHYSPPAGIFLTVGGFDFQTDPSNVEFLVAIRNDNPSGDDVYWIHSDINYDLHNGTSVDYISWNLKDHTAAVFSTDSLPLGAPVLTDWQFNHLRLESDRTFLIDAHVTSAIPEPTTILLFSLGSLLLRKRK